MKSTLCVVLFSILAFAIGSSSADDEGRAWSLKAGYFTPSEDDDKRISEEGLVYELRRIR